MKSKVGSSSGSGCLCKIFISIELKITVIPGRKTLHGHWLLWIEDFQRLREMLFDANKSKEARKEYLQFIENAMSSSYHGKSLQVIHDCGKQSTSEINFEDDDECMRSDIVGNVVKKTGKADELFYDFRDGDPNKEEQMQLIRNTRSKHKKDDIGGKILHCDDCEASFNTTEIVDMSLEFYKSKSKSNVTLPIYDKRLDIAAIRYPYTMSRYTSLAGKSFGTVQRCELFF